MNVNGLKGYERCDEIALHRWESEGGGVGVRPQPRPAVRNSSHRDFVASRNGSVEMGESPSGKNLERRRYSAGGRLPRRAATMWA
jgi:hypothetical protein